MTPVTHLTITPHELDTQQLLGMEIRPFDPGEEGATYGIWIRGWVAGRNAPVDRVELVEDGQIVKATAVHPAPGPGSQPPGAESMVRSEFLLSVNALQFARRFTCELRAVFENGGAVPLAVITGQRQALPAASPDFLQPLMVTSLGRTGTTLLLNLLANHPEIVTYRLYPYEVRPATYWTHMLQVLSAPADYAEQISHPHGFAARDNAVGANPFYSMANLGEYPDLQNWSGYDYARDLTAFCQQATEHWYRRLAKNQDQPNPVYFAEKFLPHKLQTLLWELYPRAREIFLVRDFRDVASSVLAFNAQRGFDDFGRQHASSDEEYLLQLRHGAMMLHESWKSRSSVAHLVRYEDLITAPNQTLVGLLDYLGLDASPSVVERMLKQASVETPQLQQHKTSQSAERSVGRWQRDLPPALQEAATETLGDLLTSFGYS